jgi:hypothetical protein
MKNVLVIVFIGILFLNCASALKGDAVNDNQDSAIFSNNGSVSFENDEYLLIGCLVSDLQRTLEIWNIPDSQGIPEISTTTNTKINEPVSLFLVFAARKNGINMTYNFKLLRPDGTFSANAYNGLEIAKRDNPNELIYSARQLPTIIFDETDKPGKYQFHISVFDNNILIVNLILEFNLIE